jgi:hypothetical protein
MSAGQIVAAHVGVVSYIREVDELRGVSAEAGYLAGIANRIVRLRQLGPCPNHGPSRRRAAVHW